MDLTVSRPIRIFALVALLLAVGGGGTLMLLGRSQENATQPPVVAQPPAGAHEHAAPAKPAKHAAAPAKHAAAPAKHRTAAPPKHAAAPVTHRAASPSRAKPKQKQKPPAASPAAKSGLPKPLVAALAHHRVVVVSVVDPQSRTDAISYAEAKAGAKAAGVGFVAASVLNDAVAGPLTALLPGGGLLPDPGVLVYRRPDTLVFRIDGFADRATVAQAATAAATAQPLTASTTATPTP